MSPGPSSLLTYLTTNKSPGPRDLIMAADPVVDGFGRLRQVNLRSNTLNSRLTNQVPCFLGLRRTFLRRRGKPDSRLRCAELS